MSKRPVVIGLQVCTDAVVDHDTGHVTLANCLRKLQVDTIPTSPQDFVVCSLLADGYRELNIMLVVANLSTEQTLVEKSWKITFRDTLAERWLYINLRQFVFPAAGKYEFLLRADGEWLSIENSFRYS